MQFWIDKEQEKKPDAEWKDAYVFSINRKKYSTIFTNITDSWYRMDQLQISTIYEDLFIIGLSIFALDKRVSRRKFKDCWTREISVSIPVLEYEKWKHTELQWENILGFLTGDHWHITFRKIGTNKKNLKEYPDKERELWRTFDSTPYELRIAMGNLDEDEMVSLLDYSKYYDKLEMPIPRNRDKVLEDLQHEKFIKKNDAGTWDITNMGALMIAKDLKKFESLHRRTVRVIWYKENSRLDAIREKEFCAGYAFSHEEIVQYIMTIIPQEEVIVDATRKSVVSFPEIAIRELLANAMIHQDLQQRGTNPMVEVFKNRIEFSNAGAPLVAIERIVDSVPVSRNENIAGFMHKCGICEERGSGYDKIVEATGKNELLAPRIENQNNQFTKAILFAKVPFELTTKEDRMRTCYMQACLAYVNFEGISNSDIRKIFGLGEKEKAKASRLLTSAVEGGYIKVMDPDTAPRYKKYIPYWA